MLETKGLRSSLSSATERHETGMWHAVLSVAKAVGQC